MKVYLNLFDFKNFLISPEYIIEYYLSLLNKCDLQFLSLYGLHFLTLKPNTPNGDLRVCQYRS